MGQFVHEAEIGERVRALRRSHGLSMRQLAIAASVSQPFISKLEAGKVSPSLPTLYALADALQTSPGALLPSSTAEPRGELHLRMSDQVPATDVRVVSGGPDGTQVYFFDLEEGEGDPHFPAHDGQELLVVLHGVVRSSRAGHAPVLVHAGESRAIDPSSPHGVEAEGGPARFILVCTRDRN